MARFTYLDILFCSFRLWHWLDHRGYVDFNWMYPSLLWLPEFGCPWVVASPWLGNGGGGGAPYAIDPVVQLA
jgi:hypothetical protein